MPEAREWSTAVTTRAHGTSGSPEFRATGKSFGTGGRGGGAREAGAILGAAREVALAAQDSVHAGHLAGHRPVLRLPPASAGTQGGSGRLANSNNPLYRNVTHAET